MYNIFLRNLFDFDLKILKTEVLNKLIYFLRRTQNIIIWMLHQIFLYSNKGKLVAG